MARGGGGQPCKCILLVYVAVFALMGFYILQLGLSLRCSDNTGNFFENQGASSNAFAKGVEAMIFLGLVLVVGAWIGKKGIYDRNKTALEWFAVFLACLAAAAFGAGEVAYSERKEAGKFLIEFYTAAYIVHVFTKDQDVATVLTFIQNTFRCCGMTGVPLIELVKQTCPKPEELSEFLSMPSCPMLITKIFATQASLVTDMFNDIGRFLIGALICSLILIKRQETNE